MAVEAVNNKNNAVSNALYAGVGLGAATGLGKYYLGAKRHDLDEVFKMEPDSFKTTIVDKAEGDDAKKAAKEIEQELKKLDKEETEAVKPQKAAFDKQVKAQKLAENAPELEEKATAQANFDKKLLEKVNEGKDIQFTKLEDVPKDTITNTKKALKDSDEAKALKAAEEKITKAKEALLRNAEAEDLKKVVSEYDTAVKNAAEARATKIANLVKDEKMTGAFAKIKEMLPKVRDLKSAGIWGGIAAVAGAVIGYALTGSKQA